MTYRAIIGRYIREFGDRSVNKVTLWQILTFLNRLAYSNETYSKRIRYSGNHIKIILMHIGLWEIRITARTGLILPIPPTIITEPACDYTYTQMLPVDYSTPKGVD